MATFHAIDTSEVPEQSLFVIWGSIVEGEIQKGMFVHFPVDSRGGMRLQVDNIEFAPRQDGKSVHLWIRAGPRFMEMLRTLKIKGGTFRVHDAVVD